MRFRDWAVIVVCGLTYLTAGIGLAARYDLEWLRTATLIVAPLSTAGLVMAVKTTRQRRDRSMSADSVEFIMDRNARATAFLAAIVITAVATAAAAIMEFPAWLLGIALLSSFAVTYWAARAMSPAGGTDAGDE